MTKTICLAAAILFAGAAQGAPAATSGQKCANLTEVALLARALAEAKVEKPRAHAVLRRMYSIPDEQAQSFARLVLDSAYTDTAPAGEFAQKFEVVCIASGEGAAASVPAPRVRM